MITLKGVSKRFDGAGARGAPGAGPEAQGSPAGDGRDGFAVMDFSLEVAAGETVVLVGPSGSGKTTILRMINRLIEPTSGSILVDGQDVGAVGVVELRRRIGYVIQSIGLLPHRTVAENIATVPKLVGWDAARIRARVAELAAMLELEAGLLARYPAELSGGQRQRVGVARALGVDPPVMLMDEPFGAVDPIVRARLQDQLLALQERLRKTIVLVTHDVEEALKLGDRIAIINRGGALEQYDSPEDILRSPANGFVRSFVGAERGLKRLGLRSIAGVELDPGPIVSPDTAAGAAAAVMAAHHADWAAVVSGGTLMGWVDAEALAGHVTVAEATPRPFSVVLSPGDTLREALDAIVTGSTHVAAIAEQGRYCGILTLDALTLALRHA